MAIPSSEAAPQAPVPAGPLPAPEAAPAAVMQPGPAAARPLQTGRGIAIMCLACLMFAMQDALSRQLGSGYSPYLIVMLRYWFFAAFSLVLVARMPGGIGAAVRTRHPWLQLARGILLVADVTMMLFSFVILGLVATHAVFAVYPLLIVALSGPMLGERIGWRRWGAVAVGFAGMMVVLQPGAGTMAPAMILAFGAALSFALYSVLTRHVSHSDPATVSFFWASIIGAIAGTAVGIFHLQNLAPLDWFWMALLCMFAATSHWLLIKAYEYAEASVLQPFSYTQLPWVAVLGLLIFGEALPLHVVAGVAIIVGAGLFSLWRARVRAG